VNTAGEHHDHEHPGGARGLVRSVVRPHSHDPADSIDTALTSSAEGIRALKLSFVVLFGTAIAQLIVVLLTHSVALLADTIHNFSDAMTAIPIWVAFVLVRRPPTRRFTYGLGRAEDLAGLFVVLLIAVSAVAAGYESVRGLIHPTDIANPWVVVAAGLIGFVGNEVVAVYRIRVGRKIGSAALVADGLHARIDGITSLAVAAGAIGVLAGFRLADPIVGLLITVAILAVMKGAATEVFVRLLDGVDPTLVDTAERSLSSNPEVQGIRSLQLRWTGHELHAVSLIEVDDALGITEAYAIAHGAEHDLKHAIPQLAIASVNVRPST
jgi:cation diffusion facilitator family transporter